MINRFDNKQMTHTNFLLKFIYIHAFVYHPKVLKKGNIHSYSSIKIMWDNGWTTTYFNFKIITPFNLEAKKINSGLYFFLDFGALVNPIFC